jgi:polyisoprenoid-binding protein YceI
MTRFAACLILVLATALPLRAAEWVVDHGNSRIIFSGSHTGNRFEGTFDTWTAAIRFDPADLSGASVRVEIDTASARTGNPMYDSTLPGEDWINTGAYPRASFSADSFTQRADGRFEAGGTLTIRDVSKPLELVFTLETNDNTAVMSATHTLNRLDYGLGTTSDAAGDWVSKDIELSVKVTATRD